MAEGRNFWIKKANGIGIGRLGRKAQIKGERI